MPEGSWKCEKCNNINYPFRTKCNRQNCGADKPSDTRKSPPEPVDDNDQVCLMLCVLSVYICYLNSIITRKHIGNLKTAQVPNYHVKNDCLSQLFVVYSVQLSALLVKYRLSFVLVICFYVH